MSFHIDTGGVRVESDLSPIGVRLESDWSPSGVRVESDWSPIGVRFEIGVFLLEATCHAIIVSLDHIKIIGSITAIQNHLQVPSYRAQCSCFVSKDRLFFLIFSVHILQSACRLFRSRWSAMVHVNACWSRKSKTTAWRWLSKNGSQRSETAVRRRSLIFTTNIGRGKPNHLQTRCAS